MKKILMLTTLASLSLFSVSYAKDEAKKVKRVVIDRTELKTRSKAGQAFEKKREQKFKELQAFANSKEQEAMQFEQGLRQKYEQTQKDPKNYSEAALQEEIAKLERMKRRAAGEIEEKKYDISAALKREDQELDRKILALIPELAEKNGWTEVKDAQGNILFAAHDLDKTDAVLKALNDQFEKETLKANLVKKS